MTIVVQKYGGSSVADAEKIARVADRVAARRRTGVDVVVVVSAMGKATDGLLELARSVAATSDPPRRELDMLLSTGERVTMALVSIALAARGIDAISFTGSQSGIITNDRHFDARIIEVRPHRIEDELARGKVVIVAGYQGMSYRREITTLGRGGSDTTAVALAAALGAESCEIYSDVDGVYSADPRVVKDALHLPDLGLEALSEMAEAGAKVLNAQAVSWARKRGIRIHARRTNDPVDGAFRETVTAPDASHSVVAIVGLAGVATVTVNAPHGPAFLRAAAELYVPLLDLDTTPSAAGLGAVASVPVLNLPDYSEKKSALCTRFGADLIVTEGRAIVSVVGDGLLGPVHHIARFYEALTRANIAVERVTATPLRIAAVIEAATLDAAQRALHTEFVTPND